MTSTNAVPLAPPHRSLYNRILCWVGLASTVTLVHAKETVRYGSTTLLDLLSACPAFGGFYVRPFYLASGHLITIFGAMAKFTTVDRVLYQRVYLQLPDEGVRISPVTWSCPYSNAALDASGGCISSCHYGGPLELSSNPGRRAWTHRQVYLLQPCPSCAQSRTCPPGGSHESYIRSVVTALQATGKWRVVVPNYRGCGYPAVLTSSALYHGGLTTDLRAVLLFLSQVVPAAPLFGIGFSLGANVLTKYLGEVGEKTPFKAAMVVSNPFASLHPLFSHISLMQSGPDGISQDQTNRSKAHMWGVSIVELSPKTCEVF